MSKSLFDLSNTALRTARSDLNRMSNKRTAIVYLAFGSMDPEGKGAIDPEVLVSSFHASQHPDVLHGKQTAEAARNEFLMGCEVGGEIEGKVTVNEFERYYEKVGQSIESDEYFESMIRNLYGVTSPSTTALEATVEMKGEEDNARTRILALKQAQNAPPPVPADYDLELARARNNSKAVLNRLNTATSASAPRLPYEQNTNLTGRGRASVVAPYHATTDDLAFSDWSTEELMHIAAVGPHENPDGGSIASSRRMRPRLTSPIPTIPAGIAFIVQKVQNQLCSQGSMGGFVQLQRTFRSISRMKQSSVGIADFKIAMKKELKLDVNEAEMRMLFEHFCHEKGGTLNVPSFVACIRPVLNDKRTRVIMQVFAKLDINGDGLVNAKEMAQAFDPRNHPEVMAGRKSSQEIQADFLESFDVGGEIEGLVTQSEFINYYTNIGAAITSDDYFELMIRNVWHVFGMKLDHEDDDEHGDATRGHPISRRVLVTHSDGSQYVEEVHDFDSDHVFASSSAHLRVPMTIKERLGNQGVHTQTFSVFDTRTNAEREADREDGMRLREPKPLITATMSHTQELPPPPRGVLIRPPTAPSDADRESGGVVKSRPQAQAQVRPATAPASSAHVKEASYGMKHIISKLKGALKTFGALGYVTLERKFRALDQTDRSKLVTLSELKAVLKSMNITVLGEVETRQLFEHFDMRDLRAVDYDDFMRGIRDPLTTSRWNLVRAAFAQLDQDGRGVVDASLLAEHYDPSQHPEVIAGRCSPQHVLEEFLSTFDVGGEVSGKVTLPEFTSYYANLSANIDNDDYFELMLCGAWHVDHHARGAPINNAQPSRVLITRADGSHYIEESVRDDESRGFMAADDVDVSGGHKMVTINKRRSFLAPSTEGIFGVPTSKKTIPTPTTNPLKAAAIQNAANKAGSIFQPRAGVQVLLDRLKAEIKERGVQSLIGLQRQFREVAGSAPIGGTLDTKASRIHHAHTKLLTLAEFKGAFKGMYFGLGDADLRILFEDFDLDGDGLVDVDFFLRVIRAPLNERRRRCVTAAFNRMDKQGQGAVEATEIAASFDATQHPEVANGRITAEAVLKEFLETFDVGGEVDGQVTLGEFVNYYTNLGAHIDNDDYFERVVKALWHVDTTASTTTDPRALIPSTSAAYKSSSSSTHQSSSGGASLVDPALISVVAGVKSKPNDLYWGASWGSGRPGFSEGNQGMGKKHAIKAMTQTAADLGVQLVLGKVTQELQRRGAIDGLITLQRRLRAASTADHPTSHHNPNLNPTSRAPRVVSTGTPPQDQRSHVLTLPAFAQTFSTLKYPLEPVDLRVLFDHFDTQGHGNGLVDYSDIIRALRRPLSSQRLLWVQQAFSKLAHANNGGQGRASTLKSPTIDASTIIDSFDASAHPDVLLGARTKTSAMEEWLNSFDVGGEVDGQVTLGEFVNYYTNLGAHIDNDDYFEVLVNAWRKPATDVTPSFASQGGGGASSHTRHSDRNHGDNDEEEEEEEENHEPSGQGLGQNPPSSAFSDSMRVWRDGQGLGSQFVGGRGIAAAQAGVGNNTIVHGKKSTIGKIFEKASNKRFVTSRNNSQFTFM